MIFLSMKRVIKMKNIKIFITLIALTGSINAKIVYATAYTSTRSQTDSTPCIAASGANICKMHKRGIRTIAVSRNLLKRYPLGSRVKIENKTYIVEDTMNKKWLDRIDIYLGTNHYAMHRWKNRKVNMIHIK